MVRTRVFLVSLMLATVFVPAADAEAKSQETHYVAGGWVVTIFCSKDPHPFAPVGPPDPYDPVGWLFSGEPECAGADAHNALREAQGEERVHHGFGGAGHRYDNRDAGTVALANTADGVSGPGQSYLIVSASGDIDGEPVDVTSEGCGPQAIVLPPYEPHWQPWPEPSRYWWAFVERVAVDDDLSVCVATTGTLYASWGADA